MPEPAEALGRPYCCADETELRVGILEGEYTAVEGEEAYCAAEDAVEGSLLY